MQQPLFLFVIPLLRRKLNCAINYSTLMINILALVRFVTLLSAQWLSKMKMRNEKCEKMREGKKAFHVPYKI